MVPLHKVKSVWKSSRLSDRTKTKLVEFFAPGVPVYRVRFRCIDSAPAIERFFRLIPTCCAYEEHCRVPFEGAIECDESSFGGNRKGERGWGAAGKVIVFGILMSMGCWTVQAGLSVFIPSPVVIERLFPVE